MISPLSTPEESAIHPTFYQGILDPSQDTIQHEEKRASRYVNFLSDHAVPKAMSLSEIEAATKEDTTLQKL